MARHGLWGRFTPLRSFGLLGLLSLLCVSCVAQQADLQRVQKELDSRIAKLSQEKNTLEQSIEQAKKESASIVAQQRTELAELKRARAQINSELRSIREETLTQISGDFEKVSHDITDTKLNIEEMKQDMITLNQGLEKQDKERAAQFEVLTSKVDEQFLRQTQDANTKMEDFRQSLLGFKQALGGVKDAVAQEETRATQANALLSSQIEETGAATTTQFVKVNESLQSLTQALAKANEELGTQLQDQERRLSEFQSQRDIDANKVEKEIQANSVHLQELTQSISQLRDVLDTTGTALGGQADQLSAQMVTLSNRLNQVEDHHETLSKKLDSDTQALRTYLNQEVKATIGTAVTALETEKVEFEGKSTQLEQHLQGLDQRIDQEARRVQELNEATIKLRETLDAVGGMLGKRGDEQIQQLGGIGVRVNRLETSQTAMATQQEANAQTTSSHLSEVNASVQSVIQTLNQVSSRLEEQERRLTAMADQSGPLKEFRAELISNVDHLNQLTGTVTQLREIVDSIGTKMGARVDAHEREISRLANLVESLRSQVSKKTAGKP